MIRPKLRRDSCSSGELAWIGAQIPELLILAFPAVVPRHDGHSARNWLLNPKHAPGFTGIDFEHARSRLSVQDIIRVWLRAPITRADLAGALFTGDGRPLTSAEQTLMERLAAPDTLCAVVWAAEHLGMTFPEEQQALFRWLQENAAT